MGAPNLGLTQFGVDPNRNYGGFWGGPGASTEDTMPFGATAQDYRGPGPFSEVETRNIRNLVSSRQVVTMITNHTFSNLMLVPPGLQAAGPPPDDKAAPPPRQRRWRARTATPTRRDTSSTTRPGRTEDWSYNATGGLGFTFEIGPTAFHPNYASMIAEYNGTTAAAGDGGGNRAAYLTALASTVNRKRHSIIRGTAPRGAFLTLSKRFKTPTSPVIDGAGEEGDVILFRDRLRDDHAGRPLRALPLAREPLDAPAGRSREEAARSGAAASPSDPIEFSGDADAARRRAPTPRARSPPATTTTRSRCQGGQGIDNGKATVRVTWADAGERLGHQGLPRHRRRRHAPRARRRVSGSSARRAVQRRGDDDRPARPAARQVRRPGDQLRRRPSRTTAGSPSPRRRDRRFARARSAGS